jgi:hypothetical protein
MDNLILFGVSMDNSAKFRVFIDNDCFSLWQPFHTTLVHMSSTFHGARRFTTNIMATSFVSQHRGACACIQACHDGQND